MERRQRRAFTDDYKRQAVDLVASSGRSVGSVAKELGTAQLGAAALGGTTRGWARADGGAAAPHHASGAAVGGSAAEVARLQREFGTAAQVRAGLHRGPVVVGEMGPVKKEIALSGDTLNTAARLVDVCRDSDKSVIASADLLDRLVLPPHVAARSLGLHPATRQGTGHPAFARWPRRRLIHASRRYEKMGT